MVQRRFSKKAFRLTEKERIELATEGRLLDDPPPLPRTRGDCVGGSRPCPFMRCRHHLALEVTEAGSLKMTYPELELEDMVDTCSLDVAERGEKTLEEVAFMLNITKERARQIEDVALGRLERGGKLRLFVID